MSELGGVGKILLSFATVGAVYCIRSNALCSRGYRVSFIKNSSNLGKKGITMKLVSVEDKVVDFSQDVLIVPSVGLGNIGQLCCDLLLSTCRDAGIKVSKVGVLKSRNVLPMVGNDPLGKTTGEMCINLEVFRIPDHNVTILQIRAPIVEGAAGAFAQELATWSKSSKFSCLVLVGAADSSSNFEQEVMLHQFRHIKTASIPPELSERLAKTGLVELVQSQLLAASSKTARLPLSKGGLMTHLHRICASDNLPFLGLVLFCKEGFNVPEACMMTAAVNLLLNVIQPAPQRWTPPATWQYLDGAAPLQGSLY
uniref:Proteasome assembly chaperone 2 n=1 Tax=Mucochytrium quahogii TaxID=96639 RepID=A0A7S2W2H9_9STRA